MPRACTSSDREAEWTLLVEAFLSNGMEQQEADDQHHRAGYAIN
jgi:hypothetical protein